MCLKLKTYTTRVLVFLGKSLRPTVFVCVCERERERGGGGERKSWLSLSTISLWLWHAHVCCICYLISFLLWVFFPQNGRELLNLIVTVRVLTFGFKLTAYIDFLWRWGWGGGGGGSVSSLSLTGASQPSNVDWSAATVTSLAETVLTGPDRQTTKASRYYIFHCVQLPALPHVTLRDKQAATFGASVSGTFLQTLQELVTPLKGDSLRSCPPTSSTPSERFEH